MARQTQQKVIPFPVKGLNVVAPRTAQPEGTSPDLLNVRAFDTMEGRVRGGSRPGLSKYCSVQIGSTNRIQDINYVTTILNTAPNTTAVNVRDIKLAAVCNGTIYSVTTTNAAAATPGGARSLSNTAPFIFSTPAFGKLYYTDGISYKIWTAATNVTSDWTPTAGSLPGTDGTYTPRLIEGWRGRIVLSGLRDDPHNFFMSKLGDPLDWDYSPNVPSAIQAVAGNFGIIGKIGDVINCIIPHTADLLVFGCDHSIWVVSGDPGSGGKVDLISDSIGMAFGRPWCKDSSGNIYFFSSRGEVYQMPAGLGTPNNISETSVSPQLKTVDLNTTLVRMAWDETNSGFHLFMSPIA